jgi:hypothetical protein
MASPFAASSSFLTQRLSPIPAPLLGLQALLELLHTLDKLLLLTCREAVPDASPGAVEELPCDSAGGAVHLTERTLSASSSKVH